MPIDQPVFDNSATERDFAELRDFIKPPRGFAAMNKDLARAISSLGGKAVPPERRSFSRDHTLASRAGQKGGFAAGRRQEH